jgi:hypothetical protein
MIVNLILHSTINSMSKVYKNTYTPPKVVINDYHPDTPEDEYDHDFVFEVKGLESDRVELRPFIVRGMNFNVESRSYRVALDTFPATTSRSSGRSRALALAADVFPYC